jgi:hypothetical protein
MVLPLIIKLSPRSLLAIVALHGARLVGFLGGRVNTFFAVLITAVPMDTRVNTPAVACSVTAAAAAATSSSSPSDDGVASK